MGINMIAAVGKNMEIGYNNNLLCHLPKDLRHFKDITCGHPVIMGMKTWLSLPKKPLPNRRNIVVSRKKTHIEGAEVANSIAEALKMVAHEPEAFVIGGAMMYKLFLPFADKLYLTRIVSCFAADTWFPTFSEDDWLLTDNEYSEKDEKNIYDLYFQTLTRKK